MIRFSKLADYAVVILSAMAQENERMSASGLSQKSGLPEPTVAKVLKLLVKHNIVSSTRGVQGGYLIGQSASAINIADIVTAVDGPVALTACVEGSEESCCYAHNCSVKGRWDQVNGAVQKALEGITLADMIGAPYLSCHQNNHNKINKEEVRA
ncbi:MAG: SUF system Fe-S cluster assembly regulator [Alphaproteobacteria bacterium]